MSSINATGSTTENKSLTNQLMFKLNREKFELKCPEVPFIGYLLTSEGLKPNPKKVEAICSMPKPEDVQAVQRFVNTVKYLSRFLEDLSDMSQPFRRLTHKDVP